MKFPLRYLLVIAAVTAGCLLLAACGGGEEEEEAAAPEVQTEGADQSPAEVQTEQPEERVAGIDVVVTDDSVEASPLSVPEGTVRFFIENTSTSPVNNLVIARPVEGGTPTPEWETEWETDFSTIGAGESGDASIDLSPGSYSLWLLPYTSILSVRGEWSFDFSVTRSER